MLGRHLLVPLLFLSMSAAACRRAPAPDPSPAVVAVPAARSAPPPLPPLPVEPENDVRESSGLALARIDGHRVAFVADEDDAAIVEVDLDVGRVVRSSALRTRPRDLLVQPDGTLAVTLPDANAVAVFVETSAGLREERRVEVPNEPLAMARSEGEDPALYVSSGASHSLVRLRGKPLAVERRWDLAREPRAVMVGRDGARVFVAHAAEGIVSVVPAVGDGAVARTEIGSGSFCSSMGPCTPKRQARYGQALVRQGDGGVAVPVVQTLPNPPLGGGITRPMKTAVMPVSFDDDPLAPTPASLRLGSRSGGGVRGYGVGDGTSGPPMFMRLASLDEVGVRVKTGGGMPPEAAGTTCLEPRAAVAVGDRVLVACMGSKRLDDLRAGLPRQAIPTPAGPTALALERGDQSVLVWSTFERKLSRVSLVVRTGKGAHAPAPEEVVELPRTVARDAAWLRGRELFFGNGNVLVSGDGRACANCHIDGRDDGLTWETPKGKRRTRTLAGQLARAPYGWLGEHATLEDHVRITFKQLGGRGLPDGELADLLAYVRSLPAPAAAAAPGQAAGKQLFVRAECDSCHTDGGSDRLVHDVGTGSSFMTPTLAGIGSRQQLMHDGRFASLDDLVARSTSMGSGSALSADERRALVGYLQTL